MDAEYIPSFVAYFYINISRFAGCVVFLGKEVGHYLKPINKLLILSFSLSQITLDDRKILVSE